MDNSDQSKEKNKGGRPLGALSKMTKEAREKARATGLLPHEFLLAISQGQIIKTRQVDEHGEVTEVTEKIDLDRRIDAAKAAAPYYAPKISTVEVITGVGDDELIAFIKSTAAQAGISLGADGVEQEAEAPTRTRRTIE